MAPIKVGCPAILIALLAGLAAPISVKGNQIDDYIKAQMRQLHISGASFAIVRDGHIAKAQGYGFANLELQASARKDTVYEIGSTSKQFTAAAIMMLVEEDKVRLDDTITKYFTEAPQRWRGITIRHLLTHTSGIQNHVAVPHWLDVFRTNLAFETTPTRGELLKMFFKLPLEFQPGESWAYDNTGYYLLGMIIEKASGKSYWQFIDKYHGHRLVQHSGGTPGFSSVIYRFIDDRLTILILTNHSDMIVDQLAIDLAGICLPALKRPDANPDDDPKTTEALKDVVSELLKSKYQPDSFTPATRIFLGTATGKAFWKWFAEHGTLGSFIFSDRENRGDGRVLRYKVSLRGNSYWFSAKMTKDGKIAQIYC